MLNPSTLADVATVLVIALIGHLTPGLTRPDLFFAVTVEPAFRQTDAARRILGSYRVSLWTAALAALVSTFFLPKISLPIVIAGMVLALIVARRQVRAHAAAGQPAPIEVELRAPAEGVPGGLAAVLLPFVALGGMGVWALTHLDQLPARLPVHWGFNGANRWVVTSPESILRLLLLQGLVSLILTAILLMLFHGSRRVSTSGPAAAAERAFRRRLAWMLLMVQGFLVLLPAFSLLQAPAPVVGASVVALMAAIFAFLVSLLRSGQGGTRLAAPQRLTGDRTPDARWIAGMIYFNRADPALLVEKRFGIGYTFNFGNPWSWVLLTALVTLPAWARLLLAMAR